MPTYRFTHDYSCPARLTAADEHQLAQTVEAAAVAQLRLISGQGHIPPTVYDALALIRAWYGAQRFGLPTVVDPAVPADRVLVVGDDGHLVAAITNLGGQA